MRKFFFIAVLAIVSSIFFQGCNSESFLEEQTVKMSTKKLGEEEVALKELLINTLPKIETLTKTSTRSVVNEEQIEQTLSSLSVPVVNMLKSHGFTEKDWAEFEGTDDPAFILSGIVFLGMLESNSNSTHSIKTRSESDDSCFDPYKVLDCVLQATGVATVIDAFLGNCITKYIAYEICKQALKKVAGPIAVAIALGDFAHCMGWLEF